MRKTAFLVFLLFLLLHQFLLLSSDHSPDNCYWKQLGSGRLEFASASGYVDVNVSEAKRMIDSKSDLAILDVRTLEEYESGHIHNAVLVPVTELQGRIIELDKDEEILVYCRTGSRSASASQILVDNGFSKVYNILGGITAWNNAGYPIEIFYEGDLNADGTINIVDISIVAISFGSTLGDPRWNELADLDKNSIIDILDITKVAVDYGKRV